MRAMLFLVVASAGCKTKGTTPDDSAGPPEPTDTVPTEPDTGSTGDTGPAPTASCWVPFEASECFDATLEGCALPTVVGADNLVFLNQCTESDYVLFDNGSRIPASTWVPGTSLPPI